MGIAQPEAGKKYYTPAEANKALPLVRAIVQDISDLAHQMRDNYQNMDELEGFAREDAEANLEADQSRMQELVDELQKLGIELKDFFTGLIDFPCWISNREVYLCWKLGETSIAHWHEIDAGFAGRQDLQKSFPPEK